MNELTRAEYDDQMLDLLIKRDNLRKNEDSIARIEARMEALRTRQPTVIWPGALIQKTKKGGNAE